MLIKFHEMLEERREQQEDGAALIFVILLITMFSVMTPASNVPILGSPGKLWDLLQQAAIDAPAFGTKNGEYLTMESGQGVLLGAIILVSGFGSVFVDPSVSFCGDCNL